MILINKKQILLVLKTNKMIKKLNIKIDLVMQNYVLYFNYIYKYILLNLKFIHFQTQLIMSYLKLYFLNQLILIKKYLPFLLKYQ